MKNLIKYSVVSVVSAAISGISTYFFMKKKMEADALEKANREIEDMRAYFEKKYSKNKNVDISDKNKLESSNKKEDEPYIPTSNEVVNYKDIISKNNYNKEVDTGEVDYGNVVIPPDEYGENPDYDQYSFTFYSDGVLTDEYDNVINDVNYMVGNEALLSFGKFEKDSVFVKNDIRKTYYEILKDDESYEEYFGLTSNSNDVYDYDEEYEEST